MRRLFEGGAYLSLIPQRQNILIVQFYLLREYFLIFHALLNEGASLEYREYFMESAGVRYYRYQLSKARRKSGDKVLTLKKRCCQGQLSSFPIATL